MSRRFGVEFELLTPKGNGDLSRLLRDEHWKLMGDGGWARSTDGENHEHWHIKSDSSVHGDGHPCEIASPVLEGEEGLSTLLRFAACLRDIGCKTNNTCGLHIHREAVDLRDMDFMALYYNYYSTEKMIALMLDETRWENGYCKHLPAYRELKIYNARNTLVSGTKHQTVGFASYALRGTIEFRHAQGTLDGGFLENWWLFIDEIFRGSTDRAPISTNLDERLKHPVEMLDYFSIDASVRKYFKDIYNAHLRKIGLRHFDGRSDPVVNNGRFAIAEGFAEVTFEGGTIRAGQLPTDIAWGVVTATESPTLKSKTKEGLDEYLWP